MTDQVDRAPLGDELAEKRLALERERDRIFERIRSYPSPVTACDEQFDSLLEERDRIARELTRVRETREEENET